MSTRFWCLPPSNFVEKNVLIIDLALRKLVKSAPKHSTFALLCLRAISASFSVLQTTALTPGTLLAVIDTPYPEPQIKIPVSACLLDISLASLFAITG